MLGWIHDALEARMDAVHMLQGLAFVVSAVAILAQPRESSRFRLAGVLWLYVAYNLLHVPADFLGAWLSHRGADPTLRPTGLILTAVSYTFLFEFGRRLLGFTGRARIPWWVLPVAVVAVAAIALATDDPLTTADVLTGYLVRVPAGLLAGMGLLFYPKADEGLADMPRAAKYFRLAGVTVLVWTFFCGVLRAEADFFPANWLSAASFHALTDIPVEVFRTACGLVAAWALVMILRIFNWETVGAVERARAEARFRKDVQDALDVQSATNDILRIALEERSLDETLDLALGKVLALPWLSIEAKGAAFVSRPGADLLEMRASRGLSDCVLTSCATVPYGGCFCGRAASTRQTQYSDRLDERHDVTYPGIAGHGHYSVPMLLGDEAVGVLNLYLKEGHPREPGEEAFLRGVADALAGLVSRRRSEEQARVRMQRITALRDIASSILATPNMKGTLGVLLDRVIAELHVDAAAVLLFDEESQTLRFAAGAGFRTQALQYTRLKLGEGFAGRSALERRVIGIPDLGRAPGGLARAPLLPQEGFVSYLGIPLFTPAGDPGPEGFQAYYGAPLVANGRIRGVIEAFHRTPLTPDREWLDFLESLAAQAALAVENASLFEGLTRTNHDLQRSYEATLEGWVQALDMRDRETEGHTQRVTEMAEKLGRAMGLGEAEVTVVRRGALLHDIGKIGIPDGILHKPGPLTPEEWDVMRRHSEDGHRFTSSIEFLKEASEIPWCHHEKWDGTGYPRGLKGEQIPLGARIFAVIDVYDALCSERPYKPAWPREKARAQIRSQAGTHFDPHVVDVFLSDVCPE